MATGVVGRAVLAVVCGVGVFACGLDFDRYDPMAVSSGTAEGGGDDGSIDVGAPEAPTGDASPTDGGPGIDAPKEAGPGACKPAQGQIVAPQASGPITVDGDLGDWGTPFFVLLDSGDAAFIMGPNGTCNSANAQSKCLVPSGESAEVALLWDSANLYVAVRVTVAGVGGTSTTPYLNDAVEVYLRGDPAATGNYTNVDHQYVVDWQNTLVDYGPSPNDTALPNPPGVTSAVKVAAGNGSYVVEMQIALTQLGQSTLTPGQTLGFDLGVDHGQGSATTRSFLVWWMSAHSPPTCTTTKCTGCNPDQPYCDTLDFGLVCAD
jgi:hypothetical protein